MAKNQSRDTEELHYYSNPISATRLYLDAIAELEKKPENFVTSVFCDKAEKYVEQVIGPRRSSETLDAYKVRMFADLVIASDDIDDRGNHDQSIRDHVMYAREATESGETKTARRWYLRLIVDTGEADPNYWLLYGTFCIRLEDWYMAKECTRRAIAIDALHKLANFVQAAISMTCHEIDRSDELESSLESLRSTFPRFSEAHLLAALHYRRMDMLDRSVEQLSLANRYVDCDGGDDGTVRVIGNAGQSTAVWEPVDHRGDPAVRCAVLLIELGLVDLAGECLRTFADRINGADRYHYLMAVVHHKRSEFDASSHHLNTMSDGERYSWWPRLLMAHNDYGAGRIQVAVSNYKTLISQKRLVQSSLALSRTAENLAVRRRYTEAANYFRRACTVTGTPALKVKLAACFLLFDNNSEAEKYLAEAVAADGADNGEAWYYLYVVNTRCGHKDLADVCHRQATELGFTTGDLRPQFILLD